MLFDKILDFMNLEKRKNRKLYDHIYQLLSEAHELATIINSTIDSNIFYDSYDNLIEILEELTQYEGKISFSSPPSKDLQEIKAQKIDAINAFIERCQSSSDKPYSDKLLSLYSIKRFWLAHPQSYTGNPLDTATPEQYLLYGKTLMLWAFGKSSALRNPDGYPVYFHTECKLSNPRKLHIALIDDGYLGTPSAYEVFSNYKVTELRIIADSIGCKKGGSKAELITRILDNLDSEIIQEHIDSCNYYSLTAKGSSFLTANSDLVELHRHNIYDISLSEFCEYRFVGNKRRSFTDTAFQILSNRIYNKHLRHYYYMIESDYRHLHEITLSEHKYDIAIDFYLKFLYLETCLIRESEYLNHDWGTSWDNFDSVIVLTTRTAANFINISSFYSPVLVDNIYKDPSMPPSFLTCTEFKMLINDMMEQVVFDFEKYNILFRKRLREYSEL